MFSRKAFSACLRRNQISPADRSSLPCRTEGIGSSSDRVVHGNRRNRQPSAGNQQDNDNPDNSRGPSETASREYGRPVHSITVTKPDARNRFCILSGIPVIRSPFIRKKASAPAQKRAGADVPILIRPKQAFSYPQAAVSKAFARSRTGPSSRSGRVPIARSVPPEFRHS